MQVVSKYVIPFALIAVLFAACDGGSGSDGGNGSDGDSDMDTDSDIDFADGGPYRIDPPDPCFNQFWVAGCEGGACGGQCQVANACSPPDAPANRDLPMTFICPRFMVLGPEMVQAAKDDAHNYGWDDENDPPFVYGVVGHDPDPGGVDEAGAGSTCCQCYQLILETPEPHSPQPPEMPVPKPLIVQSFNTAAGGPNNFDLFTTSGGYGYYNACYDDPDFAGTSDHGYFMYDEFPSGNQAMGGVKALNLDECRSGGGVTRASLESTQCQDRIEELCNETTSNSSPMLTNTSRISCIATNQVESFYHQNWQVRVKRVECPEALTRVTGCRLQSAGLPQPDPTVKTVSDADSSWKSGYTTTTMQDCCKPSCAWTGWVAGEGLTPVDNWNSFYACDINGVPFTAK